MTDPIGDMIIRVKNALMANHQQVTIPHSKMKEAIANILLTHGYITAVEVVDKQPQKELLLTLKYVDKLPAISEVKRVSKPGRRLYSSAGQVVETLGGYGLTILTTSKGVMSGKDARKQNVGGEVLCQIW